ncbi:MAG: sporulation protein YunB [Bacteroidota bacterium]
MRRRRRGYGTIRFEIPPYKRRKFFSLMILGAFLMSIALGFWLAEARLRPSLRALALAKAKVMATMAVNKAVSEGEAQNIAYQDLISVRADNEGRPMLLQPNTGRLNRLASQITLDVQRSLLELGRTRVRLPLGQVLGMHVLGSWGPSVTASFLPAGTVEGHIIDSFSVAGINQTRHRISVRVTTEVKVIVPLVAATACVVTDVPLAEAVIVGQVPGVYVEGGALR